MRRWKLWVTVLVALAIAGGVVGCVFGSRAGSVPASAPTSTPVATCTSEAPSATVSSPDTREAALKYMRSADRIARYKLIWPNAEKVARAIFAGKLGPYQQYDSHKIVLVAGETGWGAVQTVDGKSYAWVWWNGDGSPDYSRGVKGFAVGGLNIESEDGVDGPYTGFIDEGCYTQALDIGSIGRPAETGNMRGPTSILELIQLDREVWTLLPQKMREAGLDK